MKDERDFVGLVILAGKHPFCIVVVTWIKYSLLIGQLSLFTVNKYTWSCLYSGFLCLFSVYLFDHCAFCILCYYYYINMDFIYYINWIIVFLPWFFIHPLLRVIGCSPIWTALKLCLNFGQENLRNLMFIACDSTLSKEFLPGLLLIIGWYLVRVVITWTDTRRKFLARLWTSLIINY